MKVFPKPNVTRFEQLVPGELFIFDIHGTQYAALKAVDHERDGDKLIVLLGPNNTEQTPLGLLLPWEATTVVSFGKNFVVRLPTLSSDWSFSSPERSIFPLVVTEDEVYLRAFNHNQLGRIFATYVKISDGQVVRQMPSIVSYALKWQFALPDEIGALHPIVNMGL